MFWQVSAAVAAIPEVAGYRDDSVSRCSVWLRLVSLRKLPAVRHRSSSVICSDKTGTLTKNEMTVRRLWLASGWVERQWRRLCTAGELTRHGRVLPLSMPPI